MTMLANYQVWSVKPRGLGYCDLGYCDLDLN
jgi:hypothetical protein